MDIPLRENQIREYRTRRKLRLRDVAELVDAPALTYVWEWERGRHVPSLQNALRLSAAVDCPVEVLFSQQFQEIRKEVRERQKRLNISRQLY